MRYYWRVTSAGYFLFDASTLLALCRGTAVVTPVVNHRPEAEVL